MEHFDAMIVGAGLSGIGAACHVRQRHPRKSFAILEGRNAMGGFIQKPFVPSTLRRTVREVLDAPLQTA